MDTRFLTQPFEDGSDLRDFFTEVAMQTDLRSLRIVVAWAKRSGVARVSDHLAAFRGRGGVAWAIAGVGEGGASAQGLAALKAHTDSAWVFHDRGRTFHPKVYLAESDDRAVLMVGSHNLTSGGLSWNYEAGLLCHLDFDDPSDLKIRDDVVEYFDRLVADYNVCVPLDDEHLQAILADPTLVIQDEDHAKRPHAAGTDVPEDDDSANTEDQSPAADPVFGKSSLAKRRALLLPSATPFVRPKRNPAPVTGGVVGSRPDVNAVKRWFKLMDGTAAQQPPGPKTNPTGNLRLTQEDLHIDHKTYFREVLFGDMDWRPSEQTPGEDVLWLQFSTVVDGDYLGNVSLRLSHDPKRISNQSNVPSLLHWGDLGARVRQNNYQGQFVTLEREADNTFALTIAPTPTGDFLF